MTKLDRILSQLNQPQQEAVTYHQGPLLILAGAGSGKTRALTHRTAYLIQKHGIDIREILLVTFTNRAAHEMKERLIELLGSEKSPFTGTFHSFCARILRREGKRLGIPPDFLIFDERDQLETVKHAFIELDISSKKFSPASVLNSISQAKNEMIGSGEYVQFAQGPFQKAVSQIFPIYQKLLKKYRALDFDDLLFETVRLFLREKSVLGYYQERYCHLLIDEYQDTNQAQYQLSRLLAGRWRNLCVVGDCSQSIYSWRGANFRNVLNLKSDFPELKTINLEQNYRSTKTILQAANQVISRNTSHPILNLWTENEAGDKISRHEADNELEEALFVVEKIRSQLRENSLLSLSDFAVLYRTNAQSRTIEEALLRAGISYLLIGGTRFYERKEIKDCLAWLRLVLNPADLISYQRVQKLGKRRLDRFYDLLEETKVKELSTLEILDQILQATHYLELYHKKNEEDLARLENIKELRSVATQFPELVEFLENVALVQQDSLPANKSGQGKKTAKQKPAAVNLMTIHAAKGSEFDFVFLIGLEEGLFPHSRSLLEKEELEEERRLCYVGLTRAKQKLYLTHTRRRLIFGQRSNSVPSRFINDINPDLIEDETSEFDRIRQELD
ncbi:MAG: UvrD-helicase domain-containing protein [Candidatus Pacebacteria bacterium]|nr:UvrD-helicase domain-containing protein [Candidatus Paceibacterota bacterium]